MPYFPELREHILASRNNGQERTKDAEGNGAAAQDEKQPDCKATVPPVISHRLEIDCVGVKRISMLISPNWFQGYLRDKCVRGSGRDTLAVDGAANRHKHR